MSTTTNTKLIALAIILAATVPALQADVAEDAAFEVPSDQAETLLTAGLARLAEPAQSPPKPKSVQARVLLDCHVGRIDDVVTLSVAEAKQMEAAGQVDTNKEAVAYAKSLRG